MAWIAASTWSSCARAPGADRAVVGELGRGGGGRYRASGRTVARIAGVDLSSCARAPGADRAAGDELGVPIANG